MIQDYIFDTNFDTKKIHVAINTSFTLRSYLNKDKTSAVYLNITSRGLRERINLEVNVDPKKWNKNKQRVNPSSQQDRDLNLFLDNIDAKVTGIKVVYRLSQKLLSPSILKKELFEGMPRVNFVSFMETALKKEKKELKPGTYRRYLSVLNKLKDFRSEIYFSEIDHHFFADFRKHLMDKNNMRTTINSNIIVIKKYLRLAQKFGIKLKIEVDDVQGGKTSGNRTSLNIPELKKIAGYYFSDYINESNKLILGYFLFSCMTGLRISDVYELTRDSLSTEVEFTSIKTGKDQIIALNNKAVEVIEANEDLFVKFPVPEVMNRKLKTIATTLGIKKKISFHVARHTFATNFLRMGGQVTKLQVLLGHSKIETTMIYVHILAAEANEEVFLLDKIF